MNIRVLNAHPWRFALGDQVYVQGWPGNETAVVTAQQTINRARFPHYLIVDSVGIEWRVSQLHLSRSPIESSPVEPVEPVEP